MRKHTKRLLSILTFATLPLAIGTVLADAKKDSPRPS